MSLMSSEGRHTFGDGLNAGIRLKRRSHGIVHLTAEFQYLLHFVDLVLVQLFGDAAWNRHEDYQGKKPDKSAEKP